MAPSRSPLLLCETAARVERKYQLIETTDRRNHQFHLLERRGGRVSGGVGAFAAGHKLWADLAAHRASRMASKAKESKSRLAFMKSEKARKDQGFLTTGERLKGAAGQAGVAALKGAWRGAKAVAGGAARGAKFTKPKASAASNKKWIKRQQAGPQDTPGRQQADVDTERAKQAGVEARKIAAGYGPNRMTNTSPSETPAQPRAQSPEERFKLLKQKSKEIGHSAKVTRAAAGGEMPVERPGQEGRPQQPITPERHAAAAQAAQADIAAQPKKIETAKDLHAHVAGDTENKIQKTALAVHGAAHGQPLDDNAVKANLHAKLKADHNIDLGPEALHVLHQGAKEHVAKHGPPAPAPPPAPPPPPSALFNKMAPPEASPFEPAAPARPGATPPPPPPPPAKPPERSPEEKAAAQAAMSKIQQAAGPALQKDVERFRAARRPKAPPPATPPATPPASGASAPAPTAPAAEKQTPPAKAPTPKPTGAPGAPAAKGRGHKGAPAPVAGAVGAPAPTAPPAPAPTGGGAGGGGGGKPAPRGRGIAQPRDPQTKKCPKGTRPGGDPNACYPVGGKSGEHGPVAQKEKGGEQGGEKPAEKPAEGGKTGEVGSAIKKLPGQDIDW
jgi:hypothetical protein